MYDRIPVQPNHFKSIHRWLEFDFDVDPTSRTKRFNRTYDMWVINWNRFVTRRRIYILLPTSIFMLLRKWFICFIIRRCWTALLESTSWYYFGNQQIASVQSPHFISLTNNSGWKNVNRKKSRKERNCARSWLCLNRDVMAFVWSFSDWLTTNLRIWFTNRAMRKSNILWWQSMFVV